MFLGDSSSPEAGLDSIYDYSTASGDIIDLADVLVGYNPVTSAITDFVRITTDGADSILEVDINGTTGGVVFVQIATLFAVTGLTDERALLNSGNLIAV